MVDQDTSLHESEEEDIVLPLREDFEYCYDEALCVNILGSQKEQADSRGNRKRNKVTRRKVGNLLVGEPCNACKT